MTTQNIVNCERDFERGEGMKHVNDVGFESWAPFKVCNEVKKHKSILIKSSFLSQLKKFGGSAQFSGFRSVFFCKLKGEYL